MANVVDISTLVTDLGNHFIEHTPVLLETEVLNADSTQFFTKHSALHHKLPIIDTEIDDPGQPDVVVSGWNPKTLVQHKTRFLDIRPWKVDFEFNPATYYQTYLSYIHSLGTGDYEIAPFHEWLFSKIAIQARESIENFSIWRGVENPAGTGTIDVCDGILKLVADAILSSELPAAQVVATGAINPANVVDKFEDVFEALPEYLKSQELYLFCNPTIARWYARTYRDNHGSVNYNNTFEKVYLDGTRTMIVPTAGMGASGRVIIAAKRHLHYGIGAPTYMENFLAQWAHRDIHLMMHGRYGVQILPKYLTVNDQP